MEVRDAHGDPTCELDVRAGCASWKREKSGAEAGADPSSTVLFDAASGLENVVVNYGEFSSLLSCSQISLHEVQSVLC